jgi:ethanolamine ammonia-lyase large subunit
MTVYGFTIGSRKYRFRDLKDLMAKASLLKSGDCLAGIAAATEEERMAARFALAELPLKTFLAEVLIPYEEDEVTRLILDSHDPVAFELIAGMTVGDFCDWLLAYETDARTLRSAAPGITPEMAAAVSKLMRNQDLILVAGKIEVITRFRTTIGLKGRLSTRLQPNHPTDIPYNLFHGLPP